MQVYYRGFYYCLSFALGGRIRAEVYIDHGDAEINAEILAKLKLDQKAIEAAFGEPLEWEELEGKRACRVAVYRSGSIEDSDDEKEEYLAWAIDRLLNLREVFGNRLEAISE